MPVYACASGFGAGGASLAVVRCGNSGLLGEADALKISVGKHEGARSDDTRESPGFKQLSTRCRRAAIAARQLDSSMRHVAISHRAGSLQEAVKGHSTGFRGCRMAPSRGAQHESKRRLSCSHQCFKGNAMRCDNFRHLKALDISTEYRPSLSDQDDGWHIAGHGPIFTARVLLGGRLS